MVATQDIHKSKIALALRRVLNGFPTPKLVCFAEGCHAKACRACFEIKAELFKTRKITPNRFRTPQLATNRFGTLESVRSDHRRLAAFEEQDREATQEEEQQEEEVKDQCRPGGSVQRTDMGAMPRETRREQADTAKHHGSSAEEAQHRERRAEKSREEAAKEGAREEECKGRSSEEEHERRRSTWREGAEVQLDEDELQATKRSVEQHGRWQTDTLANSRGLACGMD